MIPTTSNDLQEDFEFTVQPSYTFRLNLRSHRILGNIEELEAIRQTVYMILNTERYQYLIYTWDYGVEFKDLYGEPITYACPEIKRRITEALLMDERIIDVTDFEFDYSNKGEIHTSFTVNTIYGDLEEETVVNN